MLVHCLRLSYPLPVGFLVLQASRAFHWAGPVLTSAVQLSPVVVVG